MKKYSNLIFDFDGTLMDTAPVIVATMTAAIAELGLPARSEAAIKATIGLRLEETPAVLYPGADVDSAAFAATYRRLFPLYNKPGMARPFPDVIATLRRLRDDGLRMAIASSRSHASLQEFVDGMGLDGMFDALVGGDDVARGKPAPEPVTSILAQNGWKAAETMVVGDAAVDILMGRAAGTTTCGVSYGNGTEEELARAGAGHIIARFGDLANVIG